MVTSLIKPWLECFSYVILGAWWVQFAYLIRSWLSTLHYYTPARLQSNIVQRFKSWVFCRLGFISSLGSSIFKTFVVKIVLPHGGQRKIHALWRHPQFDCYAGIWCLFWRILPVDCEYNPNNSKLYVLLTLKMSSFFHFQDLLIWSKWIKRTRWCTRVPGVLGGCLYIFDYSFGKVP